MVHPTRHHLTLALVAGAAASALAATPALATDPGVMHPTPVWPHGVPAGSLRPVHAFPTPALGKVTSARLYPRTVRRGKRAMLRIKLSAPSTVRIVIRNRRGNRRIRVITMPADGTTVWVRLPGRAGGHRLRAGRYRIRIVTIAANGAKSKAVVRTLRVKH